MRNIHNHGDLIFKPSSVKAPKSATAAKLHILQDSGATGNRHEVLGEKISRWEKDGKEYIFAAKPFKLQHVGGDEEHGVQEMEKGAWEVLHEVEYDPWKNELKIVID